MANIASVLKAEMARIARKEVRTEIDSLKKTATNLRTQVSSLRFELLALQKQVKELAKQTRSSPPRAESNSQIRHRFTAKGFASMRARLGISAENMGRLVGATGAAIHNWETGAAFPRPKYQDAIFALRGKGKREIKNMLEAL